MIYDKIILGAGLYGLYAALICAKKRQSVLVLEYDSEPFMRATYINQARVHMGYHYPRSYSTAVKSAKYFNRFNEDYGFCIHSSFEQIYATSTSFSWTNAEQFLKFCKDSNISCEELSTKKYFNDNMCDGAFRTQEYTYDAQLLKEYFINELKKFKTVVIEYNVRIKNIQKTNTHFSIETNLMSYKSDFVLNATYASVNQILHYMNYEPFKIKYELCEIIICDIGQKLKNIGITVMDGPFFSIMPFGKTGHHSLTSVTFTPHKASYEVTPTFECQKHSNGWCNPKQLGNCNMCPAKPETSWDYMNNLTKKYMKQEYDFEYKFSLFSMKPILKVSELDDSRPTVIKYFSHNPTFVSVLSGKINTVYDLDEVL